MGVSGGELPGNRLLLLGYCAAAGVGAAAATGLAGWRLEEAMTARFALVAMLAMIAASLNGLALGGMARLIAPAWPPALRAGLFGGLAAAGFIAANALCFAIFDRLIAGNFDETESEDLTYSTMLFWSHVGGVGQFGLTGLRYAIPLPLLAVGILSAWFFWRWPRR